MPKVDESYYVTVMNENYTKPSLPEGVKQQVIKGMYLFASKQPAASRGAVRLLGSGAILRETIVAGELLAEHRNVASEICSVTSFSELAKLAREVERSNRLHPRQPARRSHVEQLLQGKAPVMAATDYVRAYPQLIALQWLALRCLEPGQVQSQRYPFSPAEVLRSRPPSIRHAPCAKNPLRFSSQAVRAATPFSRQHLRTARAMHLASGRPQ